MFQTKITSQGTISLPAAIRKKYGFNPGEIVTIEDNGEIIIRKTPSFSELRAKNAKYVKNAPKDYVYKSGEGIGTHVKEKYGEK